MSEMLYVGYGNSETFLRDRPEAVPVNVDTITENHTGKEYGIGRAVTYLALSYHEPGSDEVAYLYVKIDAWQTLQGRPFAQDEAEAMKLHRERAESALFAAQVYLGTQGVPWRQRVAAFPSDIKMLEGDASWLLYDKEINRFHLAAA